MIYFISHGRKSYESHGSLADKTVRNIADLLRQCRPIAAASIMSSAVPHLIIDRLIRNKQECSSWNLLDSLAGLMISSEKAETGRELAHQACQDTVRIRVLYRLYTCYIIFPILYRPYVEPGKATVCQVTYSQFVTSVLHRNWV